MPIRKSIRDIQTSGTISDIVSVKPSEEDTKNTETPKRTRIKKIDAIIDNGYQEEQIPSFQDIEQAESTETKKPEKDSEYRKIVKFLSEIKTIYLVAFGVLLLIILALIVIPSGYSTNSNSPEQMQKEVESVKKQFAKHLVLPENEQIDIRKITNKIEDPFFKDAEIGDYLIIFYKNRIAYIYSINKDIIINAGVVFIDPKTATTTPKIKQ